MNLCSGDALGGLVGVDRQQAQPEGQGQCFDWVGQAFLGHDGFPVSALIMWCWVGPLREQARSHRDMWRIRNPFKSDLQLY